jgi:hypothetical protein
MDKRIDIFNILRNEGKLTKAYLFPAQETITDPYEKNSTLSFQQFIPIDVLIRQISPESLRWKYTGQLPEDSIEMICELKYENTIKAADKITIDSKIYTVYKADGNTFSILKRNDYLVVILQRKAYEE